ncbi:MAG: branched-chain amino acid ABC transporter permease [Betaproteobacteria bacterium]
MSRAATEVPATGVPGPRRTARPERLWIAAVVAMACVLALPFVFTQGFVLSLLCQMGIATIFALSYNMLLGQTGLLSFGHAVYFGLGAFVAMHTLRWASSANIGGAWVVVVLPLVGGVGGLIAGLILGGVTTRRAGTIFAMISLGVGEMVASIAPMFPALFGGEAGLSANRVFGHPLFGITFGPQRQVFFLIVGWAVLAAWGMYALTRTPLGRMANAVRDNPERTQFVGYNPQRVRFLTLTLSGFFAGIAGGLSAINYEIVTGESLGALTSALVLLMAFIGGVGQFLGPVIGAVLVTFLQTALSQFTHAWLFYFGLLFLFIVLKAPGGIASLILLHREPWRQGLLGWIWPQYALAAVPVALTLAGLIGMVELIYRVAGGVDAGETSWRLFGQAIDAKNWRPWLVVIMLLLGGGWLLQKVWAGVVWQWKMVLLATTRGGGA